VTIAPPHDLAPRVASFDADSFGMPTGRELEWRFAPLDLMTPFFEPNEGAGAVTAVSTSELVANVAIDSVSSTWVPTDRTAAIARAGARSAVTVSVPREASLVEPIVVRLESDAEFAYQHVEINVGAFSTSKIVIEASTVADVSGAIVVNVADGAELTLLFVVDGPKTHRLIAHIPATLGRDARFTACTVALGGRAVRLLPSVHYAGPGGRAELLGVFLAEGEQYFEQRIFVEHEQPHCSSNVIYKGALSGAHAHTVWIGDVLVRREAIGTETYEMNRNLLLSDGPRADSVPNLELETGDVVSAGHASATGRFDDEQLFYLQSRGIPADLARQLVVRGFFADVVGRLGLTQWRDDVMQRISGRLGMSDEGASDD
jgi:Fe-S cluster assembly protein SufD